MPLHVLPGVAALAAALILTGCTNTTPPDAGAPPAISDCGASLLQDRLGQSVTGSTAADVRVAETAVMSQGTVRVIAPDAMVTQDFMESRLNLRTDASGKLIDASCG